MVCIFFSFFWKICVVDKFQVTGKKDFFCFMTGQSQRNSLIFMIGLHIRYIYFLSKMIILVLIVWIYGRILMKIVNVIIEKYGWSMFNLLFYFTCKKKKIENFLVIFLSDCLTMFNVASVFGSQIGTVKKCKVVSSF